MTTYASPAAKTRAATLIGLARSCLWSALALMTAASGKMPPFEMAALTFLVGGGFGLAYAAARGRLGALRQPWPVWPVGVGGLFGYHALYFAALRLRAAGRGEPDRLSLAVADRADVGAAAGRTAERAPYRRRAARIRRRGVLFWGKAGGAVRGALTRDVALGYALALGCAFVWSSYSVLSRLLKSAPTEAVAGFCLATSVLAAICHFAFETTVVPESATQWAAIVGLGLGPVGLAFYVWDHGVKHGDIRLLGVAAYAAPVLSTLILVLAGYAPATASLALACALIVGGAAAASR